MKVALLGNMNNNHFAMARYLRDHGVEADVLLFDSEEEHFHPSCDTYSLEFLKYVKSLEWGSIRKFTSTPREKIVADLIEYDVLIGCGSAPAYVHKAGMALDIFVPYGDDIWRQTFYHIANPFWLTKAWPTVYHQRRGISQCRIFHMARCGIYEEQVKKYLGGAERWLEGFPFVYHKTYLSEKLPVISNKTYWAEEFHQIRSECELMIVSHVRHVWNVDPSDPNAKGTDKLLKGWALFREKYPTVKAKLVTMDYGTDVLASKSLIAQLGIQNSVVWFPKMSRKDLMIGLLLCDIVCAEFENSFVSSGVIYEAQVAAKPILMHRVDAEYHTEYPNLYPIMNAKEPESIAARLEEYLQAPTRFKDMGKQGQKWYETEVVEKAVKKYVDYIRSKEAQKQGSSQ